MAPRPLSIPSSAATRLPGTLQPKNIFPSANDEPLPQQSWQGRLLVAAVASPWLSYRDTCIRASLEYLPPTTTYCATVGGLTQSCPENNPAPSLRHRNQRPEKSNHGQSTPARQLVRVLVGWLISGLKKPLGPKPNDWSMTPNTHPPPNSTRHSHWALRQRLVAWSALLNTCEF